MLTKIHHVGIVVRDADEALRFYRDTLGLPVSKDEVIGDQGVRGVLLPAGETEIELLQPTREGTGVARFLEKGEGMHHVCFESTDVAADLDDAKSRGLRLIDEKPRQGLAGMIGFLHPAATKGVLVEYATPPAGEHAMPAGPTVKGFDHLVIAVKDLDEGAATWEANFGLRGIGRGENANLGIRNVNMAVGSATAYVELVSPLGESSPVGKFLSDRGEGMYLISLAVNDIDSAVAMLKEKGVRVSDPAGAAGSRLAFVSPRNTHGVSIQLRERA